MISLPEETPVAPVAKPSVCLVAIVRDEAKVIERCLNSLKHLISYWVIADTGSIDNTVEIIQRVLADVPGELHLDKWVDFSHNRNLVHERALGKADWVLSHDADEEIVGDFSDVTDRADMFGVHVYVGQMRLVHPRIFRGDLRWRFSGERHEHMEIEGRSIGFCHSATVLSHSDGARDSIEAAEGDVATLMGMPETPRNVFNLGQALKEAGRFEEAIRTFDRRVEMGDWEEERWLAAWLACELGNDPARAVACISMDPMRAEPYLWLAVHHKEANRPFAHMFASRAARLRVPKRLLAVRMDIYRWAALDLLSDLAWKMDDNEEAAWACRELLKREGVPDEVRTRAKANLEIIEEHLLTLEQLRAVR